MKRCHVAINLMKLLSTMLLVMSSAVEASALPPPSIINVPRMVVPDARIPIQLKKVDVRAEVLGTTAHTRVEMVFYNPNERVLSGELQFPLLEGQTVTSFSLDINGELRQAVPVDKEKGQQVFEDVSRTRVDPALLEKTQGNNYKLRVFPLPVQGTRRVVLEFDETISKNTSDTSNKSSYYNTYQLPLQFAEPIEQLEVLVNNTAVPSQFSSMGTRAKLGAERIKVTYNFDKPPYRGSSVSLSRKNYTGKGILTVDFPRLGHEPLVTTETRQDQTYFYAEVPPSFTQAHPRSAPKKLGLVWDASGSGALRDHGREFALLEAYFSAIANVDVELIIARDVAEKSQFFSIKNGHWQALRDVLESLPYDGATSIAALSPPKAADLVLMFSDGLSNYEAGAFVATATPLYAINAATSSDLSRLRAMSESTGGRLLNLLSITTEASLNQLMHQYARLTRIRSNSAKELVTGSLAAEDNSLHIAGILTEPEATVDLEWVDTNGESQLQKITISNTTTQATSLAANRWAYLKLANLEFDYANNRAEIRRLGNRFGMVTRETSLIVLDRVEDYVRYEIVPPESLREEYLLKLVLKNVDQEIAQKIHINKIYDKFAQKITWWEKDFPKGKMPPPKRSDGREERRAVAMEDMPRVVGMAPPPELVNPVEERHETTSSRAESRVGANPAEFMIHSESASSLPASIQLKKWESDAAYIKNLRAVTPENMYRIYLDERPNYVNSTAFFLDVADIFIERKQLALGLRILSNLAEMNLEDRHILRILAYRLLQAKQAKLAIPILQQVLVLSPNEPQSYRDLGLTYAEDQQYQLAVDHLWQVVVRPWHDRFPDIELISLAEMNAIISTLPKNVVLDTSKIAPRFLRNLPLDVRAVLSWDADNADIDLWVTDPNGEKVYFANPHGYQGGRMSQDFTGGYGPEEFSLRKAKPGKYKVQAHFYGNHQQIVSGYTTLMLRLSTGFGTLQQKDENIILRLAGQGDDVEIGTFEVGKNRF